MGMRIQGGSYSAAEQMQWQQRRQNFEALSQAISGGNLSSANDAFAKIKSQMPGGGANLSPDSFLGKIGAALQSGDLSTAQQLLASRQNQQGGQTASSTSSSDAVTAANAAAQSGGVVAITTNSTTAFTWTWSTTQSSTAWDVICMGPR